MSTEEPENKHESLAVAVAAGCSVAAWAKTNDVPRRTAYSWTEAPEFRARVSALRRQATDEAIGLLSAGARQAAMIMRLLLKDAESEAVKLSAARAILAELRATAEFHELSLRVTELEQQMAKKRRRS
jgi:hypothetical protein